MENLILKTENLTIEKVINKALINQLIHDVTITVTDGADDPIDMYVKSKAIIELYEGVMDRIKGQAITEAVKYGKEGSETLGVKFQAIQGRTTLDYSEDLQWADLKRQIKEREELLKGLKMEVVVPETGEVLRPPIPKYSGETLKVTFR